MTKSEKYVSDLCELSFLPFWSFPSPIGKKGNELCDLLVVCQNTIIIISVKDIAPSTHEDELIVYERWVKKAITESISQIYGAEKFINKVDEIELKTYPYKISLPPKEDRRIYRVAIAFGSKDHFPFPKGDNENGYVSIFDEKSTETILKELDTISDFTEYLFAKQSFFEKHDVTFPYETDFLAFYLQTSLSLNIDQNAMFVGHNLWEDYIETNEYKQWKSEIEVSYIWDIMIHSFFNNDLNKKISHDERDDLEKAMRVINLEPRINRMELGIILENAFKTKVKARMVKPLEGSSHAYVFVTASETSYEEKKSELLLRCLIARAEFPDAKQVVGILFYGTSFETMSFGIQHLDLPEIDQTFIENANSIKNELGFFKNLKVNQSKDMR